ncbi:MAG: Bax inhibitor-1/YccA family protein [Muribaculaceae bacterium]|nr:Bax inhibitor-1/YccA family protein [Muribaculaceae bacterium]
MNNWNYNEQNGYQTAVQAENELTLRRYVAGVMRKVYGKMTLGLLLTALTAFLVVSSETVMALLFSSTSTIWILFALELGLVIYLSARIDKLSSTTATALFYAYSALNGVALSPIFLAYTGVSIATTFAITAGTFGAMTVFGYVTRQDLSKIGSFLFMALIGLILCAVVNMFMHNSMLDLLISCAGVLIFVGLTAWDTQAIKRMTAEAEPSMIGKVATMGALTLYLDFINLFLYLLRFFGSRD